MAERTNHHEEKGERERERIEVQRTCKGPFFDRLMNSTRIRHEKKPLSFVIWIMTTIRFDRSLAIIYKFNVKRWVVGRRKSGGSCARVKSEEDEQKEER